MTSYAVQYDRPLTGEEVLRPLSLERVPWAWVDRLMPAKPVSFLLAVAAIGAGSWGLGLLLADNKDGFLASKEWQVQPFFLAVHFICLRLFVTCYTRNFLAGTAHTDMPEGEARRLIQQILGPPGGGLAVAIALPFCVRDWLYLFGPDYAKERAPFAEGALGPVDWLLWLIWCAEWLLNAYIWVLLVGFLFVTMRTLRRYRFRSGIEVLLHEKHYRPFLMMSAQGASVVLFFGVVNAFYVWYAEGKVWDYIGLGITGLLLLLGFTPPWLQLKANIEHEVDRELYQLQARVAAMRKRAESPADAAAISNAELAARLEDALAFLRAQYLDRMNRELGRAEGKALLLKLLAPASTVAWKVIRPMVLPG
jgi:hypothetical protein